ncbi:glutathione S-transferase family protein [Mangrovicoccus algicola]|uniref:Glutathione S-transferase family protein n=1 Tax=Mangrovicoccus algicola TaxID=2771008 RepID=A0A8J7CXM8_9RHOB|nr:glutathione S-transferase family protein [Mangrovicoccus algicola]MBE3639132.1 glutathione S-transferase family protein [Mangrovicoccus algicola]
MVQATLTISSKNYSSWSLRGWLLCRLAGLDFEEKPVSIDDPGTRQELLLLSPTVRVPRLAHDGVEVWDTLAIANYLHDTFPDAGMFPADRKARAHCRAISGEMHSGFFNLRSALPMNIKARHAAFKVFSGARPDIAHVKEIWGDCLRAYGGPFLFGDAPSVADAMFAPVCTRFRTYAVELEPPLAAYCRTIFDWEPMRDWEAAAMAEPDEMAELEVEF